MLDSPYVRRVAISMDLLAIPFEHRSVSVFSTFEQFRAINPVVKAPTLVCDDGEVLMDSNLILDYAESLARPRSLMPSTLQARQQSLRIIGLALAATEKSVQVVYERNLRPEEKQHEPWLTRIRGQVLAAFGELEKELPSLSPMLVAADRTQAGVTTAVAWHFARQMVPDVVHTDRFPILKSHSEAAEKLPHFAKYPHDGPGVPSN
jgi:glutathione S-transferase